MNIQARLRQTLIDLMKIDGIYPYEQPVIEYVKNRFSQSNIPVMVDAFGNLIVQIPGTGEPVMLSTHLDIPEPAPNVQFIEEGSRLTSDGSGILGVDPKTGLAILIEYTLDLWKQDPKTHQPVEIVLTRGEETGLLGALNLDYRLVQSKVGLVLDEDGPVTQVVTQAPAYVRVDVTVVGKIVHPREPENGINALQMVTEALQQLPWGYSRDGVTWNVGKFQAGTARNSVPGTATFSGELRSYNTQHAIEEGGRIEQVFKAAAKKYGAQLTFERELEFEGYQLTQDHHLFKQLESIFQLMDLKPNYFSTFGGSDANVFNAHGIRSVPIGSGYYNAHQYTEAADTLDMIQIYEFLWRFVATTPENKPGG